MLKPALVAGDTKRGLRLGHTGGPEFPSLAATRPLFPFFSPPGRLHNPTLCLQMTASFTSILCAKRGEKQEESPSLGAREAAPAAQTAHRDTVLVFFFKRKDDGAKLQHSSALQLGAARANTHLLGLSCRFVVRQHRKTTFRALRWD